MKKLIVLSILAAAAVCAVAQSVTITVVANGGGESTTNIISVQELRVKGLLEAWVEDCKAKTNASPPAAALTFGQFVVQEIGDKGAEYQNRGAIADMLDWGITNPPAKLVSSWPTLTLLQKTNAANYVKEIGN